MATDDYASLVPSVRTYMVRLTDGQELRITTDCTTETLDEFNERVNGILRGVYGDDWGRMFDYQEDVT